MATISKRILGDKLVTWHAKVRRKGYPAQSKSFLSHRDAELWAATVESEMGRGVFISRAEAERTLFKDALDRYEQEVTPGKRSAEDERHKIGRLRDSRLAAYSLTNLNSTVLAKWRDARLETARPSTVVRELALISHIFTVARKDWGMEGLLNPAMEIRKPSLVGTARKRRLEAGEEDELLARARRYGGPIYSIIVIALETAMRRSEIANLKWGQIDMKRRVIEIPITKNGEARDVPLSNRAVQTLKDLPRNIDGSVFKWRGDSITHVFQKICNENGDGARNLLSDLCFHDLRHEATSRLFERGLNPMQVAAITGHKSLQMLKRYTHLRADDLVALLG